MVKLLNMKQDLLQKGFHKNILLIIMRPSVQLLDLIQLELS